MAQRKKELPAIEVSLFCREVAMILSSGVPVIDGIETIAENYKNTPYEETFRKIYDGMLEGGTLKAGLEAAGCFPDYMMRMVEMAELTGNLEKVLDSLAKYYEREDNLQASIKSAVTYPIVLAVLMAAVVAILVIAVLPVFNQVFESLGASAGMTNTALTAGDTIGYIVLIIVGILLIAALIAALWWRFGNKRALLDLASKLFPPIRRLLSEQTAQRFSSVMQMALYSGYDLREALTLAAGMAPDDKDAKKIENVLEETEKTGDFSAAVESSDIYDPLHAKVVRVGSKSGKMEQALEEMAKIYNVRVEDDISKIVSWIEPALVAVLTLLIGGILLSVMLPLMGIMASIG